MTNDEIDDAIQTNPGGSDLEIALAIGSDEGAVRKRRDLMAQKAAAIEKGRQAEQARLKAEEAAKEEAVKPKPKPGKFLKAGGGPTPGTTPTQRYFLRDPQSNAVIEMVRANDSRTIVIFEPAGV